MKKIYILVVLLLISIATISCDLTTKQTTTENTTTNQTTEIDKEIDVLKENVELSINSAYYLEYTLNFDLLASESLTFSSSNEAVATVSMLGKVEGKAFGETVITIRYDESLYATVDVSVSSQYVVTKPNKTEYRLGESIDVYGASLGIYDEDNVFVESVPLTNAMIKTFNTNQTGPQIVTFEYADKLYGFEVYVLSQKQELSLFDDFVYLNENLVQGEKIEYMLTKSNVQQFLGSVNVYDYDEINVYALFTLPNQETKKVYAFWYQDYTEKLTEATIISSLNTEGRVYDHDRDYDYNVSLLKDGEASYRIRFMPELAGAYNVTLIVEVDQKVIQTIERNIQVALATDDDYKGVVQVDENNNRHFIFENNTSYIPVGQNVGWYTSTQRKHYDYLSWFEQMGAVDMNYARVWMAPWGYSVFWDDLYNYDSRQDNMFSLDKTLEYADEYDIYIQLCLLNHGMFSAETNPMWPNDENNWYISRYGANPYAEVISDSGDFFSETEMKDLFKNQLKYVIARYGYSDMIMSWELFNEVDWIETYTALYGNQWHSEMAEFIKTTDPYDHLISTSEITESFLSSNYQVFHDDNIDFVSIHRYGIFNHLTYLPKKQNNVVEIFDKPVLYDEVGYQGWGGDQQYEADPNNISLHQELWGGALGGGAGTAMNWWWESWIDQYNCYDAYQGIATYSQAMNLIGTNYQVVTSEDGDYDDLSINHTSVGYMGYLVDDRAYLYIYDDTYTIDKQILTDKNNVEIYFPDLTFGNYKLTVYDTFTGEIIDSETLSITTNNDRNIDLPGFNMDIAITLEKINN